METMYAPQNNGPHTTLVNAINPAVTSITVADGSILPDAPNVLTIGLGEDAELVLVQSKTGNILTVERGYNGTTAKAWNVGDWLYRAITAQDVAALQSNVEEMQEKISAVNEKTGADIALNDDVQITLDEAIMEINTKVDDVDAKTGADILLNDGSTTTVNTAISEAMTGLEQAVALIPQLAEKTRGVTFQTGFTKIFNQDTSGYYRFGPFVVFTIYVTVSTATTANSLKACLKGIPRPLDAIKIPVKNSPYTANMNAFLTYDADPTDDDSVVNLQSIVAIAAGTRIKASGIYLAADLGKEPFIIL